MLERDPLHRLGTATGASEVKESPFFEGIDWNNLLRRKSAFVPQLEHEEDCSYFDTRDDRYQHDVDDDEDIDGSTDFFFPSASSYACSFVSDSFPMEHSAAASRTSSNERKPVVARRELGSTVEEPATTTLTAAEGRLTAERLQNAIVAEAENPTNLVTDYLKRQSEAAEERFGENTKDYDNGEEEIQDENMFHAFASCSPRFSVVLEQSRMAELLPHLRSMSTMDGGVGGGDEVVTRNIPRKRNTSSVSSSYSDCAISTKLTEVDDENTDTTPTRDASCLDEQVICTLNELMTLKSRFSICPI